MNRIRIGCVLTVIAGAIYGAAGLYDSIASFAAGAVVAMLGIIGYGCVDYVEYHRDERMKRYRAEVWHRRDLEALRASQGPPSVYSKRRDGL